jgi:GDP-L-fucose synthase
MHHPAKVTSEFRRLLRRRHQQGEPIRLPGGGRPRRDILHVDDLSAACSAFADSVIRHGLYNLGGGRAHAMSLSELVATMEEVSGLQAIVDAENLLPDPRPMNYVSDLDAHRSGTWLATGDKY